MGGHDDDLPYRVELWDDADRHIGDRIALARAIAARTKSRFIEILRERGGGKVPITEEQLKQMRGGLTAEEYRWKLIRQHSRKLCEQKQQGEKR
jgi:hypothetical protein